MYRCRWPVSFGARIEEPGAHVLVLHLVHHGAPRLLPAVVIHHLAVIVVDVGLLAVEVGGGPASGWGVPGQCQGEQQEGEGGGGHHGSTGDEDPVTI